MKHITVQQLQSILKSNSDDSSIVIDVRSDAEHKHTHIPDVLNMPLETIEKNIETLRGYKTVYIHCQSGRRSQRACEHLQSLGLHTVVNVTGGIGEWEAAGFELQRNAKHHMPIMQQVLLVAGLLIVIGFAGSVVLHPYMLALPLFVGFGLMYAGISGHCFMALLLSKMPWNK